MFEFLATEKKMNLLSTNLVTNDLIISIKLKLHHFRQIETQKLLNIAKVLREE